jgi:hypothetical protein
VRCRPTTYYTLTVHLTNAETGDVVSVRPGDANICEAPTCTYSFPVGTIAHVSAGGNAQGSMAEALTGDCAADAVSACAVTMDQNRSVTASFIPGWNITYIADSGPSPDPQAVVAGTVEIVGVTPEPCSVGVNAALTCGQGVIPAGTVVFKAHPLSEHVASWRSTGEACVVTSVDAPEDTCTLTLDQPTQVNVVFSS